MIKDIDRLVEKIRSEIPSNLNTFARGGKEADGLYSLSKWEKDDEGR